MNIDAMGKAQLQMDVPAGDYSTLSGVGSLVTDTFGNVVAYRYSGQWKREQGSSGGSNQYGQFVLDLSFDSFNNICKFVGFWTYGNEDPLYSSNKWIWQGA